MLLPKPDIDPDRIPRMSLSSKVGVRTTGSYAAGGMRLWNRMRHTAKCLLMRRPLSLHSQSATEPRALVRADESALARRSSKNSLASTRARHFSAARQRRLSRVAKDRTFNRILYLGNRTFNRIRTRTIMPRAYDWMYSAALCFTTRRRRVRTRKPLVRACNRFRAVLRERSLATNCLTRICTPSRCKRRLRWTRIASRRRMAACSTIVASLRLTFDAAAVRLACHQYTAPLMKATVMTVTPSKVDRRVLMPALS